MSQENVELVRRFVEASARGDFEAALALMRPDIEFWTRPEVPDLPASYVGHAGMRDFWGTLADSYTESFRVELEELIDAGDYVVLAYRQSALVRASESRVDAHQFCVFRVQGGKLAEAWVYSNRGDALEAAGLRE
jgi:ketosteroid isomerase-like protein